MVLMAGKYRVASDLIMFADVPTNQRINQVVLRSLGFWDGPQPVLQRVANPDNHCAVAMEWYQAPGYYAPCSIAKLFGEQFCAKHLFRLTGQLVITRANRVAGGGRARVPAMDFGEWVDWQLAEYCRAIVAILNAPAGALDGQNLCAPA